MSLKKIDISSLSINPFEMLGEKWALLTGGNAEKFNPMTVAWGQMGVLWGTNVLTCYVRTNRYTYDFIEDGEYFTISFMKDEYKDVHKVCGSKSGRDCDKVAETGMTPVELCNGTMSFDEASLVFVCRKLHSQEVALDKFTTSDGYADKFYKNDALHIQYISEIVGVYSN